MPLTVEGFGPVVPVPAIVGDGMIPGEPATGFRGRIDVGLVNNMPDGALKATEEQFARLLALSAGPIDVRLHLFALPEVPRGPAAAAHLARRYGGLDALLTSRLDALIVTGAEPVAASLADEPFWPSLARVVDWAEHNTASTIWSCLAAHAAVLHLDGIERQRLPEKRFGLFECVGVAAGGLLEGAPSGMRVPHSRWNDLGEGTLRSHGYRIASRSMEAGIDMFTKQWGSLFVFLQGHPEYDPETLFREYRRDARRFITGERDRLPTIPSYYFDAQTERDLAAFEEIASRHRDERGWHAFPRRWGTRAPLIDLWQVSASRLYANWLGRLAEAKA